MTRAGPGRRFTRLLAMGAIAGVAAVAMPAANALAPASSIVVAVRVVHVTTPDAPLRHHHPPATRHVFATAPAHTKWWAPLHPVAAMVTSPNGERISDAAGFDNTAVVAHVASHLSARAPPARSVI